MNINRWDASLICRDFSLNHFMRERENLLWNGASILVLGVLHYTWSNSISRKFCWVFSPMRVCQDKYICSFVWLCLSFFQWSFAHGYHVMMINVLRYCISNKFITWYQSHPEIILCAPKTLLQLHLLNIRVSCLKT